MNREILFRGKRTDNGEWVEGDRIIEPYGVVIQYYEGNKRIKVTVNPETVGQYTGLKDKNGNKIFEGDIIKFTRYRDEYVGKVVYEQRICGLDLWYNVVVGAYGEEATYRISLTDPTKLKVIGNIHDNPELLEEE